MDNEPRWPEGLIAASHDITPDRLLEAYREGMFPWYSAGQPVLWWSPDPRMVLRLEDFRLHRSLRKTMRAWAHEGSRFITLDKAFDAVIAACAAPRGGQDGTWITPAMQRAYRGLHHRQHVHSIEVWRTDPESQPTPRLIGGLYGVSIGRMFFGESMFAREPNASKLALAALVALLEPLGFAMIDCQQNTRHLASLGAAEIPRSEFLAQLHRLTTAPPPNWSAMSTDRIAFPAA